MSQDNTQIERIEGRINKDALGAVAVSRAGGGVMLTSMADMMEFSKLMSVSGHAVPKHLRGNPGACMAVCIQAVEWRMSPFAVAAKSYCVNDVLSYESQLVHAVVEQRAPIKGRVRHEFEGAGDKRQCRVWAISRDGEEELSYTSPHIGQISPKNSPLWKTKPDLQLYYNTVRDWARVYFPDVILGVYTEDEMQDSPQMVQPQITDLSGRVDIRKPKPVENVAARPTETPQEASEPEQGNEPSGDEGDAPEPTPQPTRRSRRSQPKSEPEPEQEPGFEEPEPKVPPAKLSTKEIGAARFNEIVAAVRAKADESDSDDVCRAAAKAWMLQCGHTETSIARDQAWQSLVERMQTETFAKQLAASRG